MKYDPTKWILWGIVGTPIALLGNNGCDSAWANIIYVFIWWFACWVMYVETARERNEAITKTKEFLKDVKENGWKKK